MYMQATTNPTRCYAAALTGVPVALQCGLALPMPASAIEHALRAVRLVSVPARRRAEHPMRADLVAQRQILRRAADDAWMGRALASRGGGARTAAPSLAPRRVPNLPDGAAHLAGERLSAGNALTRLGAEPSRPRSVSGELGVADLACVRPTVARRRFARSTTEAWRSRAGSFERRAALCAGIRHGSIIPWLVRLVTPDLPIFAAVAD